MQRLTMNRTPIAKPFLPFALLVHLKKGCMSVLALDLGGTKLAAGLFTPAGECLAHSTRLLESRQGAAVGSLMQDMAADMAWQAQQAGHPVQTIGIAIPGIYDSASGTVWAPNIPGWEAFPLLQAMQEVFPGLPVHIASDRSCYILGEYWQGNARGCLDAIYLAVGTGIGAGIMSGGQVLHGARDIAGAIGWMVVPDTMGHTDNSMASLESLASGTGMVRMAKAMAQASAHYKGPLQLPDISAADVMHGYDTGDRVAIQVVQHCISLWGMAVANLVSLLNPQKIILGGGLFGPATVLIPDIRQAAERWGQPMGMQHLVLDSSALGNKAGLYGAAFLAISSTYAPS